MTFSAPLILLTACWGLFAVVWSIGWIISLWKAPHVERRSSTLPRWILGVVAIAVLTRIVPHQPRALVVALPFWLTVVGAALLLLSTGLTLWARLALGFMWSNEPQIRVDHQLRTDGPYRITRNPIYTGIVGMLLGSLLMSGAGYWGVASLIGIVIVLVRIPTEERLLRETFGEQFEQYRRRVPPLIPGLRFPRRAPSGGRTSIAAKRRLGNR